MYVDPMVPNVPKALLGNLLSAVAGAAKQTVQLMWQCIRTHFEVLASYAVSNWVCALAQDTMFRNKCS